MLINKKIKLYKEIEAMKSEFNDISFIKKSHNIDSKRPLLPDEWIKLNDIFNRFINHRRKIFRKIKDSHMIL